MLSVISATTFSDIFKSSFLENVTSVSVLDIVLTVVLSFAIGLLIFLVYKKTYRGVMYSASFGVTLVAMTMISAVLILAVSSNVVLSLGMVGALSIVRFRTAIKEPLDIAFLFWSIAAGIILAAGMIPLAVFGSVVIAVVLIIFVNRKTGDLPYIVIISCSDKEIAKKAESILTASVHKMVLKNTTVSINGIELNYEVRLKDGNSDFIYELSGLEGVKNAVLVSYNGDYLG